MGGRLPHAGRGHRRRLGQITEVSDAGRVSELKVVVKGERAVLLVDGEELVGAKQNRVLNLSMLVPAPVDPHSRLVRRGRAVATPSGALGRRRGRSLRRAAPRGRVR